MRKFHLGLCALTACLLMACTTPCSINGLQPNTNYTYTYTYPDGSQDTFSVRTDGNGWAWYPGADDGGCGTINLEDKQIHVEESNV